MKKKIARFLIISLLGSVLLLAGYTIKLKSSASRIDKWIAEYTQTGEWEEEAVSSLFTADSAEVSFAKGMKYYTDNQISEAEQYFRKAEEQPYTDHALPAYLYIYLNECAIQKTENGNVQYVEKALHELAKYPKLTDQTYWVWNLVYSIIDIENPKKSSQDLLEEYIDNAKGLSEAEVLQMQSYLGILKNIMGDYSESILLFYDILNKTQDLPRSYAVVKTQSICIDYIADMYYSYEDYDKATEFYQQLLDQKFEDPYENAKLKYTAYLNIADIHLKQREFEETENAAAEIEKLLPYLDEKTAKEVRAFLFNILSNAELEQDNLEGAISYFKECEAFMKNNKESVFFDTDVYFGLTQSKILKKSGDFEQAITILNRLLNNKIVEGSMRYKVRSLLTDTYWAAGKKSNYYREREILLAEQNARIRQYQSDYCEVINYYDQLVSLRKEHNVSMHRNEVLGILLFIVLILLLLIIRLSLSRYYDSITDSLSGLYNRKQLEKEILFYEKNSHKLLSYGIIMADIDFFKKYNDTYGHAAGDEVIQRVSSIIRQSVRERDIAIRYGGEEFLILLKNINGSTIESIAERIHTNIQNAKIMHQDSVCSDYVSLSLGAFYVQNTALITLSDAIKEADKALYFSKQNGRNQITVR